MFARELIDLMAPPKIRSRFGYAITQGYAVAQQVYKTHELLQNGFGLQVLGHVQYVIIQATLQSMAENNMFPGLVPVVSRNDRDYKFLELENLNGHSIAIARSTSQDIPGRYANYREKRILSNYVSLFPEYDKSRNGFLLLCFGGKGFVPEFGKIGIPELGGRAWHDSESVLEKKNSSVRKDITDIVDPRKLAEKALEVIRHENKKSAGFDSTK